LELEISNKIARKHDEKYKIRTEICIPKRLFCEVVFFPKKPLKLKYPHQNDMRLARKELVITNLINILLGQFFASENIDSKKS